MKDVALVYMLAGLSSRFLGKPKGLVKIGPNNETLIEYSLNEAIPAGFTKIILIVSEKTIEQFKSLLGNDFKGVPIFYALQHFSQEQRDKPWGTADALCSAKQFLDCPFIICNGDDLYGQKSFKTLYEHLKNKGGNTTIGYKLKNHLPKEGEVNRGIFKIKNNKVESIKETFKISRQNLSEKSLDENTPCSSNIFAFQKEVVSLLEKELVKFKEENKENRTIECLLPEEIGKLIKKNKIELSLYPTDEICIGITNPEDEERVRNQLKNTTN